MNSKRAEQALRILRERNGRRTEVVLSSGRQISVWDIAWGRDDKDQYDHLTTNISPGPPDPHDVDFIFTSEISAMLDPSTGARVHEGPLGLRALSLPEQSIVRRCVEYVLESGALSGEFETRMGVTERTVQELLNRWPEVDHCGDESPGIVLNNALNEVAHGLRIPIPEWERWFTCTPADVAAVYVRWKSGMSEDSNGLI